MNEICNDLFEQMSKTIIDNVYDYYNHKMKNDGVIGTLTEACGGTTTCGCFYVIEEYNE